MKSLRNLWAVGILVVGIGGGLIYAQPGQPKHDAPKTPDEPVAETIKLSIPEMTTRAKNLGDQVQEDALHVKHQQAVARKQKDVIKLNCVNDKLIQVKAERNIFDDAQAALTTALGDKDDSRFGHFEDVTTHGATIHKLREEADVCVGEELQNGNDNDLQVTTPGIPGPTGDPFGNEIESPGYASPFN